MIEQIQLLLEEAFRQDSVSLYFLMFIGGLLASLTPCTYPVLPLTVGYIGNRAGANRWKAFFLSLSMVIGMAVVYAVLGSIVAAVGGTFGSIMGNGWALFAIAMYFMIMGLFLLDVFYFPVPEFISRLQVKSENHRGMFGAFVQGGISGLICGPCTGPLLAVAFGAMTITLKEAHGIDYTLQIVKGGVLLFLFGLGQGALILLAGIFTGFISKLPRAGAWMEAVKKGFALLIIFASTLLFVLVGQNTDFPNLISLLASTEITAAPVAKPGVSTVPILANTETSAEPASAPVVKPDASPAPLPVNIETASVQVAKPGAAPARLPANTKTSAEPVVKPGASPAPLMANTETTPPAPAVKPGAPPARLPVNTETTTEPVVKPGASPAPLPANIETASASPVKPAAAPAPFPTTTVTTAAPTPRPDASPATQQRAIEKPLLNPAPDFTLPSLEGTRVTLSRMKGQKGVVLVFFATWCVNCMKELPENMRFAEAAQKENVVVLGINYKQAKETVERLKKSQQINYGILLDTEGTVTTGIYGIKGLPHIVGINAKGEIIYRGVSLPDKDKRDEFMNNLKQGL
jgi:cytochrome c-type biogenesis protein